MAVLLDNNQQQSQMKSHVQLTTTYFTLIKNVVSKDAFLAIYRENVGF